MQTLTPLLGHRDTFQNQTRQQYKLSRGQVCTRKREVSQTAQGTLRKSLKKSELRPSSLARGPHKSSGILVRKFQGNQILRARAQEEIERGPPIGDLAEYGVT